MPWSIMDRILSQYELEPLSLFFDAALSTGKHTVLDIDYKADSCDTCGLCHR